MAATIIDGTRHARTVRQEVAAEAARLRAEHGVVPGLAVVLVGDDPASKVYVRMKRDACEEAGLRSFDHHLPGETTEAEILDRIAHLNRDPAVHGILVQLPLPPRINEPRTLGAVAAEKDVDGFHPLNVGLLLLGTPRFVPCTPLGVQHLLMQSGFDPAGQHVVIVGRSTVVGKPLMAILCQKAPGGNATVTLCHSQTPDLARFTRQADILIAAMGCPRSITAPMVREGAVVIDVGVSRVADSSSPKGSRLVGDVDFDGVAQKARAITPVPGGVGPMTIAMLLKNTLLAARYRHNLP
ncbi:MAG: bifunctional 5,10-methylene-tetrahydrofolate dehydrogenase/5,10-methylene-tetrahydrofolate cyclohydrolase [Candidatus Tectomicrobia bacterium]|nr:bifunctional 5,10-methylene-tetrahydrofolate dehydrogenase/5,10-methylene-tetrahydrofolate cyclohydrolase [Candidatus Tectomicrobia bacterium]